MEVQLSEEMKDCEDAEGELAVRALFCSCPPHHALMWPPPPPLPSLLLSNVLHFLQSALETVASPVWAVQYRAVEGVRRLCVFHPAVIAPHMCVSAPLPASPSPVSVCVCCISPLPLRVAAPPWRGESRAPNLARASGWNSLRTREHVCACVSATACV